MTPAHCFVCCLFWYQLTLLMLGAAVEPSCQRPHVDFQKRQTKCLVDDFNVAEDRLPDRLVMAGYQHPSLHSLLVLPHCCWVGCTQLGNKTLHHPVAVWPLSWPSVLTQEASEMDMQLCVKRPILLPWYLQYTCSALSYLLYYLQVLNTF